MTALRLVATTGMSRDDWLKVRKNGIGSSDAAAAVGLSPYKSQLELWLEKTGKAEPEDLSDKEAVYWGTMLEPIVAGEYSKRSGNRIRRVNAVLQHPHHAFMLANLDREIVGKEEGPGVLECKAVGYFAAKFWEEGVPEYYQIQVLHQLAVTGRTWAEVAVLIGGQEFRSYRIDRDEEMIENLIRLESEFWSMVETETAPEVDGSDSSARSLALLYPKDNGLSLDFSEVLEMNELFTDLVNARQRKALAETQEELWKQQIQQRMGEATAAVFASGEVTWKKTKDGSQVDVKKLLTAHPELVLPYTVPKPGVRRFTVTTR